MRTDNTTDTSPPRPLTRVIRLISDRVWQARPTKADRRWHAITLVLICAAVYVPGLFSIPPIDRDESRFAQASRQMYESVALPEAERDPAMHSGGLAVPYVIDKARLNKPPLIYWIQATSAAVFTLGDPLDDAIWMYRLPSAVFATLTVLITWRIGLLLFDARAAWLGAATLAICPLVVIDAHQGRADQLLLTCTTASMWALAGIVRATSRGQRVPFRLAVGLAFGVAAGVLAKGPITPLVVVLAALGFAVLAWRFKWLMSTHPWLAALVTVATIGPWVYFVAEHFGFAEYKALVFDETVGRSAAPKEGHWGPPGYHLLLLPVLFWPGSLGLGLAVVHLWKRRRGWRPARWQEMFLVAWIVPAWIVFEFVSTKLPHYTMPMYPAVALLCARALSSTSLHALFDHRTLRWLVRAWMLPGLLLAAIPVVLAFLDPFSYLWRDIFSPVQPPFLWTIFKLPIYLIALGVLLIWWRTSWKKYAAPSTRLVPAMVIAVLALSWTFGVHFANSAGLWGADFAGRVLSQLDPNREQPWAIVGFHEDSLDFTARGGIKRLNEDQLQSWLNEHPDALIVVPHRIMETVPGYAPASHFARARIFNYSTGETLVLYALRRSSSE